MEQLKEYTLGSGHLHIQEFEGELPTEWDRFFKSTDNLIGRIKGGAAFAYTTEKYEDEDDLGYVVIEEITKEKVTMKSGVMTWIPETLTRLCSTARTEELDDGVIRVKIGGLGNQSNTRYVIGFEHKDKNLRVIIVGRNTEGFTFDFKQDSATVIDCQFRAEAADGEGTLIIIDDMRRAPVLGSLALSGINLGFNSFYKNYTADTTATETTITAAAKTSGNTVTITSGNETVESGGKITLAEGENKIVVEVKNASNKKFIYNITVNKAAA
ncbi:MAG: cadherin-like beta sandwich domain-containing protein [Oscillospiraceae bacterium]|nr:cadherin-like beta sandwich domain-containing protein [Oscillospiraceae bacterium]